MSTLKAEFNSLRRRLQHIQALVVAVHAALEEGDTFDVSDACAGLLILINLLMADLDAFEVKL